LEKAIAFSDLQSPITTSPPEAALMVMVVLDDVKVKPKLNTASLQFIEQMGRLDGYRNTREPTCRQRLAF
jgi:hypothetical protein